MSLMYCRKGYFAKTLGKAVFLLELEGGCCMHAPLSPPKETLRVVFALPFPVRNYTALWKTIYNSCFVTMGFISFFIVTSVLQFYDEGI